MLKPGYFPFTPSPDHNPTRSSSALLLNYWPIKVILSKSADLV